MILKGNKARLTDTFRILKRIRGIRRGMQEDERRIIHGDFILCNIGLNNK